MFTTPQVTDNLGHLDDVTRRELFQVCLVPTRPVSGLFDNRVAKDTKDEFESGLVDDVTNTDVFDLAFGNHDFEVALRNLKLEEFLLFALKITSGDCDNLCRTVVGINDGFADFECHVVGSPLAEIQFYHRRPP